jgi:hypothetical protein
MREKLLETFRVSKCVSKFYQKNSSIVLEIVSVNLYGERGPLDFDKKCRRGALGWRHGPYGAHQG